MKKKNHIKMRFSTLLLCCLAILLCAAPRGWAVIYDDGNEYGEHDVREDVLGCLEIGADTTVNLYASVSQYIYAYPGSILNIYSGNVGLYIGISKDEPYAVVTVYGTKFAVDGKDVLGADEFTPLPGMGSVLTGFYGNGDSDSDSFELWFLSDIAIKLKALDDEVEIDIKPGSDLNSINLKSKGVVTVAVFSITGFDAETIDPGTVLFAGASPVRWKLCDVDDDGDKDMLFHFKTQELVELHKDSTEATLIGKTFGGEDIELTDEVRIVPQKKKK